MYGRRPRPALRRRHHDTGEDTVGLLDVERSVLVKTNDDDGPPIDQRDGKEASVSGHPAPFAPKLMLLLNVEREVLQVRTQAALALAHPGPRARLARVEGDGPGRGEVGAAHQWGVL